MSHGSGARGFLLELEFLLQAGFELNGVPEHALELLSLHSDPATAPDHRPEMDHVAPARMVRHQLQLPQRDRRRPVVERRPCVNSRYLATLSGTHPSTWPTGYGRVWASSGG
ncbi:MAG: hypothetical protein NTZ40_14485 [Cyanobacteria bacterium]|nr:hypothetical protein [Cyanobacteriota bacterium]